MAAIFGLFLLALLLASAEVLVPGGILGLLAVVTLATGAYFATEPWGVGGAILYFMLGGLAIIVAVFVLGSAVSGRTESLHADDEIIGTQGVTLTTMAPSGMIQVGDRKYEAFSRSGLLEKGQSIRVIDRDNFRLIIEKV